MVEHKGQAREYIMNEKRMKRLKNIGYELKCFRCERPIVIGDHVMHKRKKIYHYQCWEQIWIDLPDDLSPEEEFYVEYGYYPTSSTLNPSSIPPTSSSIPQVNISNPKIRCEF